MGNFDEAIDIKGSIIYEANVPPRGLRGKVIRGNMKSRSAHGSRINMAAAVFKIKIDVYRNSGT